MTRASRTRSIGLSRWSLVRLFDDVAWWKHRMRPLSSWSMLRLAKRLASIPRAVQGGFGPRRDRGQVAVMFIVLMALIVLLASFTMNLGEVARLKTGTANAADSGALAAASWVASGTNEMALIAQGMLINDFIVQMIFVMPFCWFMVGFGLTLLAILALVNGVLMWANAEEVSHAAWDNAKGVALFTAFQNTIVDDTTGDVQRRMKELGDIFEDTREIPYPVRLDWIRKGVGGVEEPSWVEYNLVMGGQRPELTMGGWSPVMWGWIPSCCWTFCFPAFGWHHLTIPKVPTGVNWTSLAGIFMYPVPGWCGYTTCIPFVFTQPFLQTTPSEIEHSEGEVTFTVTQHREGGASLRFWRMRYPDQFVSSATAHYGGADVCGPFSACDDAEANLVAIQ